MVTATVLSLSGRPRSLSRRMPRMQRSNEPGHAGQPLVGLARAAVEGDLDRERPPLDQVVGDRRGDLRAVREQRDQQAALLGVRVDLEEVPAREDLAAGEQQPQAARVGDLVDDPAELVGRQLARGAPRVAHRQVVVAVRAGERTAVGELDGAVGGQARRRAPLVELRAEVAVASLARRSSVDPPRVRRRPLPQQLDELGHVAAAVGLADLVLRREPRASRSRASGRRSASRSWRRPR